VRWVNHVYATASHQGLACLTTHLTIYVSYGAITDGV
jgi:hypothetical protein